MFNIQRSRSFFGYRKVQNKISEKHKVITIGLVGAKKGAGVTHTTLMMARYFGKQRGRVAVIEWGSQEAVSRIQAIYDGEAIPVRYEEERQVPFNFHRVHYYKQGNEALLADVKHRGYQVVLIDFGTNSSKNLDVLKHMDMQCVVGRGNDWQYQTIERCYQLICQCQWVHMEHIIYILACGTIEEKKYLGQKIKGRIEILSFHKDPFVWKEKMKQEIEKILGV